MPPQRYSEVPDIQPFWQRLPRFFSYPLHMKPLTYMLLLSAATLLVHVVPLPPPFDHLIVFLGISLAFIRYAYKIFDQTAMGLLTPDQYESHDNGDRTSLPYKQFAVFAVIGVAVQLAGLINGLLFGAVLVYSMLSIPATIMVLAVTRSFLAALNPFAVLRMMTTIGTPYLGLCAFIFLLSASQSMLLSFLIPRTSPMLWYPVFAFVAMYFSLIMFNMMGYVVYQYHHLLGVPISEKADDVRRSAREGSYARTGSRAADGGDDMGSYAELIASGEIGKVLDQAYEAQRIDPENVTLHDRYHKLLLLSDRKERLLTHARSYLLLLLNKGLFAEAIGLYRAMRKQDPAFEPENPAHLLRLAQAARQNRDFALALSLINGFDKRFPRSPEIPEAYFFAAQTLCENLRRDEKARLILTMLVERYPEHPVADKARQLLNVLKRMAAKS
ncbi:MAG: outer membrane protein assembly factor BamD [Candidatus Accumulibacter sp.]|jgi:tetratricopeptide (TPR) repeat protein|nr:outer membrane protein assembly factor BamD [Accumulibacter sp.]